MPYDRDDEMPRHVFERDGGQGCDPGERGDVRVVRGRPGHRDLLEAGKLRDGTHEAVDGDGVGGRARPAVKPEVAHGEHAPSLVGESRVDRCDDLLLAGDVQARQGFKRQPGDEVEDGDAKPAEAQRLEGLQAGERLGEGGEEGDIAHAWGCRAKGEVREAVEMREGAGERSGLCTVAAREAEGRKGGAEVGAAAEQRGGAGGGEGEVVGQVEGGEAWQGGQGGGQGDGVGGGEVIVREGEVLEVGDGEGDEERACADDGMGLVDRGVGREGVDCGQRSGEVEAGGGGGGGSGGGVGRAALQRSDAERLGEVVADGEVEVAEGGQEGLWRETGQHA